VYPTEPATVSGATGDPARAGRRNGSFTADPVFHGSRYAAWRTSATSHNPLCTAATATESWFMKGMADWRSR
jgi:hypothetical protein